LAGIQSAFPAGILKIVPGPEYDSGVILEPTYICPVSGVNVVGWPTLVGHEAL
jgi:hypothetical protein